MNLYQLLLIFQARRRLFAVTLAVVVVAVLGVSLLQKKTYTATTTLVIDAQTSDPVTGNSLPAQLIPGYMATQADIITSKNVALKVIDQLQLADDPELREKFARDAKGRGTMRDWLADYLGKRVHVEPSRDSSVVGISVDAETPEQAAQQANEFAQAYIRTNLELRVEPARQNMIWFDQQIGKLRESLETAQAKLSAYQQANGIVATEEKEDVDNAQLAEISSELVKADAEAADLALRQKQANALLAQGKPIETLPEVLANPVVQSLKAELAKEEEKLDEIGTRAGKNHPQYIRAREQVDAINARIHAEAKRIIGGIGSALQVAQQRRASLQGTLDAKKSTMLQSKKQHDEFSVLKRDVESARQAYDSAMQKLSQARLQSQAKQTNVMVLNTASEPLKPSKPNFLLRTGAALLLGSLLGLGLVLLAEVLDRRVRSEHDLVADFPIPVLAVFDKPDSGKWSARLMQIVRGRRRAALPTLPAGQRL